jgi:hypothetical protein
MDLIDEGATIAVPFRATDSIEDIEAWGFSIGALTVDGDASDDRFNDPAGCVVALRAKGRAKRDTTGFVVDAAAARRARKSAETRAFCAMVRERVAESAARHHISL